MSVVGWERDAEALDGDIRLDGDGVDVVVGDALVSFEEELSITGSSIVRVGVLDPERVLIGSGLLDLERDNAERLGREVELVLDGVVYWLRSVAKTVDTFELTFEDRTVCRMRDRGRPTKASPGSTDHRAFVARLCELAGAAKPVMRDPGPQELAALAEAGLGGGSVRGAARAQPRSVASSRSRGKRESERAAADDRREQGLSTGQRLRVKTAWATADQLDIASRLLEVATRLGASDKVMVSLIAVAIQESFLENDPTPDEYGSVGVLQPRVNYSNSHAGTISYDQAMDVAFNAEAFLRDPGWASKGGAMRWDRLQPSWSIGQIGEMVEQGPSPSTYDQWGSQAEAIVAAYKGGEPNYGGGSDRRAASPLTVERDESYWDAAVRIADQRNFRFFVVANQTYYMSDEALASSRPRMVLGEETPGVNTIDWEWAPRKRVRETSVECNVYAWNAPPGTAVLLDESCGPGAGRWIVGEFSRSRFSRIAQIQLQRPQRPRIVSAATGDGDVAGASPETVGGGEYVYPLAVRGTFLGGPGVGTHRPGEAPDNWQSDNAVDIGVPIGTPVLAVRTGRIEKTGGSWQGGADRFDGFDLTLATDDGNRWFYTHLKSLGVRAGQKVEAGAQLGLSGAANTAEHLHLGVERGDPVQLLEVRT